jgi:hypothetical protein
MGTGSTQVQRATHLPRHGEEDYDDLTHINRAAQQRFSTFLAARLESLLTETGASPR